jgi:hypothetical protein
MARLTRRLRLPASPVEQSDWARVFACAALLVSLLAVAFFAQDPIVPLFAAVAVTVGHLVSMQERNKKRGFWRQVLLAGLIFGALCYLIADSGLGLFGGTLPQAHFAILLAAITSFDLKTRRNLYSSLWISLAILYLAAVYAWDYAFVLFLFGWILCLAGFWVSSHVNRFAPRLDGPRKPLAASVIATCLIGAVLFIVVPQPDGSPTGPLVLSLPNFTQFRGDMESAALPLVNLNGDATGATTTVDLHFRGRLGDAPVMYVRTAAPAYWRGLVFDSYTNGAWTATNREYVPMPPYVPANRLPLHRRTTSAPSFRFSASCVRCPASSTRRTRCRACTCRWRPFARTCMGRSIRPTSCAQDRRIRPSRICRTFRGGSFAPTRQGIPHLTTSPLCHRVCGRSRSRSSKTRTRRQISTR